MSEEFIERQIAIGLIVSDDFARNIFNKADIELIQSKHVRVLANWCYSYFMKYDKAPNKDIELVYTEKKKQGLNEDTAELIEAILDGLSSEYEKNSFNLDYILDLSHKYFQERNLEEYADRIKGALRNNDLEQAESLASGYRQVSLSSMELINPFEDENKVREAFEEHQNPLIKFPKALGRFVNSQMTRDSFVAFMGAEKKGKTYLLMEMAMRAAKSGSKVAFFQIGDMSEKQMIRRLAVYLAKRSDMREYCGELFVPMVDCARQQDGTCTNDKRECFDSPFEGIDLEKLTMEELKNACSDFPDYSPCVMKCKQFKGQPWMWRRGPVEPLTWSTAFEKFKSFNKYIRKRLRLITYPSEMLSVQEVKSLLATWEKREGYIPDVLIFDYADLFAADPDCRALDGRNKSNKVWQRLRSLSQEKHVLIITATQAAASSYEKSLLDLGDFSEDKRKYAHVTAMWGMNQTPREKRIGILRLNELVVREGDANIYNQVSILQRLQMGRPFIDSYF